MSRTSCELSRASRQKWQQANPACSDASPNRSSDSTQYGYDFPQDRGEIPINWVVGRVMRHEPHLTAGPFESLDGCFVIEQSGDDLAVVRRRLLANNHPIAVTDRGFDHRVPTHLEKEHRALTHQLSWQGEDIFDAFLSQDRSTSGDPSQHWNMHRLGECVTNTGVVTPANQPSRGELPGRRPVLTG